MDWLSILPVLPLAPGLPVRGVYSLHPGIVLFAPDPGTGEEDKCAVLLDYGARLDEEPVARWRVNLGEPQGFVFALRLLWLADEHPAQAAVDHLLQGWMSDETTDADRLTLARALAAIFR